MTSRHSILVIGQTGFVGRAIVRKLRGIYGAELFNHVRVASRNISQENNGSEAATLDLGCQSSFLNALAGIDTVIHCARDIGIAQHAVYPIGLEALIEACKRAGVKKFLYFSSISVYGNQTGLLKESAAVCPNDIYGRVKAKAEEICRDAVSPDFNITVFRPSHIYGVGGLEWTSKYIWDLERGTLKLRPEAIDGRANLIYIEDIAELVCLVIRNMPPGFSTFNIDSGETMSWNDYFRYLSKNLNFGEMPSYAHPAAHEMIRIFRKVYRKALSSLGTQAATRDHLKRIDLYTPSHPKGIFVPSFQDEKLSQLKSNQEFSISRIQQYGFCPRVGIEEGTKRIGIWYNGGN